MPLSFEYHRRDKHYIEKSRVPKIYIDKGSIEDFKKRYPYVPIRENHGKLFVDVRDFKSTSWLWMECKVSTRNMYSYTMVVFYKWLGRFPDELIELYRKDFNTLVEDLRNFLAFLVRKGYSHTAFLRISERIVGGKRPMGSLFLTWYTSPFSRKFKPMFIRAQKKRNRATARGFALRVKVASKV